MSDSRLLHAACFPVSPGSAAVKASAPRAEAQCSRSRGRLVGLVFGLAAVAAIGLVAAANGQEPSRGLAVVPFAGPPPVVTHKGWCDASAAVGVPDGNLDAFLVAGDEKDVLQMHARPPHRALELSGGDLRSALGIRPKDEVDFEGAAWLGDRLYLIGSHGRNGDGKREPAREHLVALPLRHRAGQATARVGEPVLRYRGLLGDLSRVGLPDGAPPDLLAKAIGMDKAEDKDLAPERGGLSIEGLAAGPDGRSLLLGLRSPLAPGGRAVVIQIQNPGDLVSAATSPAQGAANIGERRLWSLGGMGVRSLEFVPATRSYLVLAGPSGAATTGFSLFAWSGEWAEQPVAVRGSAELLGGLPGGPFRAEGMAVSADGRRVLLVSDDGDLEIPTECKELKPKRQRFRSLALTLEPDRR